MHDNPKTSIQEEIPPKEDPNNTYSHRSLLLLMNTNVLVMENYDGCLRWEKEGMSSRRDMGKGF